MATSTVNTQIAQAITLLQGAMAKKNKDAGPLIGQAVGKLNVASFNAAVNPDAG